MDRRRTVRDWLWVETRRGSIPEPIIYLQPPEHWSHSDKTPILVSPLIPSRKAMCVGFLDGSVSLISADRVERLFAAHARGVELPYPFDDE